MASYQWQRLWDVLRGDQAGTSAHEIPLIASLCYYSLTVITGRLCRYAVKHNVSRSLQPYLFDFITTFQVLACSLENGQMRKHYGDWAYVGTLFVVMFYSIETIQEGSGNPSSHVINYMKGDCGPIKAVLMVVVQLLGGLLSYQYARLFWSVGLTSSHTDRYQSLHCVTDLTVPTALGFAVEYAGTVLDCLIWFNAFTSFPQLERPLKCLFGSYVTLLAVDITGFYLNPLNATNQHFGCRGLSNAEHVVVYWLGPLAAVATAMYLQRGVDRLKRHARKIGVGPHDLQPFAGKQTDDGQRVINDGVVSTTQEEGESSNNNRVKLRSMKGSDQEGTSLSSPKKYSNNKDTKIPVYSNKKKR